MDYIKNNILEKKRDYQKNRIITILIISIIIILSFFCGFYFLNAQKPVLKISVFPEKLEDLSQEDFYVFKYLIEYKETFFDKQLSKLDANYNYRYIDKCELNINGKNLGEYYYPESGKESIFIVRDMKTGKYNWNIKCISNLHGNVEVVSDNRMLQVIKPLMAKKILNIEAANSRMKSLIFYHNINLQNTEDEFFNRRLAGLVINFGLTEQKFYPLDDFFEKGQVSVKIVSDWKEWDKNEQVVKIKTEDGEILVFLPNIGNPTGEALFYIADDGSTYYGKEDHYKYHNEYNADINLTWQEALRLNHLAREKSNDYVWKKAEKPDNFLKKDEIDSYLKEKESIINWRHDKENSLLISPSSLIINKKNLLIINPNNKIIEEINDEEIAVEKVNKMKNSYITLETTQNPVFFEKSQESYHQLIKIGDGFYKDDSLQIYIEKFADKKTVDNIVNNSYNKGGELIYYDNSFCSGFSEDSYIANNKYSRTCGFVYDTIYVQISGSTKNNFDKEIIELLNIIYNKIIEQI